MMTAQIVIMAVCLVFAVLVAYFYEAEKSAASIAFKVLASLSFVLLAIIMLYRRGGMTQTSTLLLGALVLGLVGDIFMGLRPALKEENRDSFFVIGGTAFGLGHFLYAAAFVMAAGVRPALLAIIILMPIVFFALSRLKLMNAGKMAPALMLYGAILGLILAGGIELMLCKSEIGPYALAGALLFIASDTMLFLFLFPGAKIERSKGLLGFFDYALMLCYYMAQLLFASAVLYI